MVRQQYNPLPQGRLSSEVSHYLPDAHMPQRVSADSPAIEVMTDLHHVPAATVGPETPLNEANQAMILRGVRSLLVIDSGGRVVGLITAIDILGERPMKVVRERGIRHDELSVRDVMSPADELDVLSMSDVLRAEVGHVVANLRRSGRQHALVVDTDAGGRRLIRGIFSASQIARQLGIPMPTTEVARTFAEIEAAFAR